MITRNILGDTGISVSRLCYGTLTLSAMQAAKDPIEGGRLLAYAFDRGVNFWDTAEYYNTYAHIREGLKRIAGLPVLSTKTYAYDTSGARDSFEKARAGVGLDVIDIFMLHEQTSVLTLLGHGEALKYLIDQRDKGKIRAVGISTHAIEPVQAVAYARGAYTAKYYESHKVELHPHVLEFDLGLLKEIDVIHPIINMNGLGLQDGNADGMIRAVKAASSVGVGIFGMKLFGGGNLLNEFDKALEYGLALDCVDSFAVGMQSEAEIDLNVRLFSGSSVTDDELDMIKNKDRKLLVESWCNACGACVDRCRSGAMSIESGHAVPNRDLCVLCSYCAAVCPEFAIKVI